MVRDKEIRYGIRDTIIFFFFFLPFSPSISSIPGIQGFTYSSSWSDQGVSARPVQTLGLATLKDIFYSCDVFEGAEKTHSPDPRNRMYVLPSCEAFNFKIPFDWGRRGGEGEGGRPYIPSSFHLDSSPISVENFDELTIVFFWKHVRPCHNLSPPPPLSWYKIYFFT